MRAVTARRPCGDITRDYAHLCGGVCHRVLTFARSGAVVTRWIPRHERSETAFAQTSATPVGRRRVASARRKRWRERAWRSPSDSRRRARSRRKRARSRCALRACGGGGARTAAARAAPRRRHLPHAVGRQLLHRDEAAQLLRTASAEVSVSRRRRARAAALRPRACGARGRAARAPSRWS